MAVNDENTAAILLAGDAAYACLHDETLMGVIETLSQDALGSIVNSKEADAEGRELAYRRIQALQSIVSELSRRVALRDVLAAELRDTAEPESLGQAYNDYYETP